VTRWGIIADNTRESEAVLAAERLNGYVLAPLPLTPSSHCGRSASVKALAPHECTGQFGLSGHSVSMLSQERLSGFGERSDEPNPSRFVYEKRHRLFRRSRERAGYTLGVTASLCGHLFIERGPVDCRRSEEGTPGLAGAGNFSRRLTE